VTALAPGTASIVASRGYRSGSAQLTVTGTSATSSPGVSSVSVSLPTSSLTVGQTTQATATVRDAGNNVLTDRVVTWSSEDAAVAVVNTATGVVTAIAAGSAIITATSESVSGTATAVVTGTSTAPPSAPVATVTVTPASANMTFGTPLQLTATLRDANNNVLTGRQITWSSSNTTNATVSATGLVSTVSSGAATITATSEGKSGGSDLTIVNPAPPPPDTTPPPSDTTTPPPSPPPPSGSGNEPTGMSLIAERPFSSLGEAPSWDTDNSLSIASDPSAPRSPSGVLRSTFSAGFNGGTSAGHTGVALPGRRVLYITYWAKYSSNWQGHVTGVNKHGYAWANGNPVFVMETHAVGSGPMTPHMAIQGSPNSDRWYDPNLVPNATVQRGQWFRMEYVVVGNTAGQADGTMDYWLNGVHIASFSGIQWTSSTTAWDIFEIRPVWGGVGDVVSSTQTLDIDHVYLSGKN